MLIAFAWRFEVPIAWVGKISLFRGPFGALMRALGGIPVRRNGPEGLVSQLANSLREGPPRGLVMPVEGSRAWRKNWKSGFYHIAREAGVPILCCSCDYARKVTAIGAVVHPTGDVRADMDAVRDFYADVGGKFPDRVSRMKLNEESGAI